MLRLAAIEDDLATPRMIPQGGVAIRRHRRRKRVDAPGAPPIIGLVGLFRLGAVLVPIRCAGDIQLRGQRVVRQLRHDLDDVYDLVVGQGAQLEGIDGRLERIETTQRQLLSTQTARA